MKTKQIICLFLLFLFAFYACDKKEDDTGKPDDNKVREATLIIKFASENDDYFYVDPTFCNYISYTAYNECNIVPITLQEKFNGRLILDKDAENKYILPEYAIGDSLGWEFWASIFQVGYPEGTMYGESGIKHIKEGENVLVINLRY